MTDTVTAKLAEWEALANAATEGPWDTDGGGTSIGHGDKWVAHVVDQQEPNEPVQARADAAFIAAAREMVPALLGFVEDVRATLAHEPCADTCDSRLNEVYPCSCWKSEIEQAARKWIGGEG